MKAGIRRTVLRTAERLMDRNPPRLGLALYEPGDARLLRLRMAYQRWLLGKLQAQFPEIDPVELVVEVIAPLCH